MHAPPLPLLLLLLLLTLIVCVFGATTHEVTIAFSSLANIHDKTATVEREWLFHRIEKAASEGRWQVILYTGADDSPIDPVILGELVALGYRVASHRHWGGYTSVVISWARNKQ